MRSILLLSLSLCVACEGRTETPRCETVFSSTGTDGSRFELTVPGQALQSAPLWQAGQDEPPLPIGKALKIANAWAAANRGRFDKLNVEEVALEGVQCESHYWYYRVTFAPVLEGERLHGNGHFIAILMDGKVIEPHKVTNGS